MLLHAEEPPDRAIPFAPSGARTIDGGSGALSWRMSQINSSLRLRLSDGAGCPASAGTGVADIAKRFKLARPIDQYSHGI